MSPETGGEVGSGTNAAAFSPLLSGLWPQCAGYQSVGVIYLGMAYLQPEEEVQRRQLPTQHVEERQTFNLMMVSRSKTLPLTISYRKKSVSCNMQY